MYSPVVLRGVCGTERSMMKQVLICGTFGLICSAVGAYVAFDPEAHAGVQLLHFILKESIAGLVIGTVGGGAAWYVSR